MSKYHAQKTTINGITFDSKLEAERFRQLMLLEKAGKIYALRLQPEFQILHGYINAKTGEKIKSTYYIGDFEYIEKGDNGENEVIVEDVKGVETDSFRIKWKLVRRAYPEYHFRKVTKEDL